MIRFRKFTIARLLLLITICAVLLALLFTPVKFTFELRGHARTSASVGDLMDIRDDDDWSNVIIRKAEIIGYSREGRRSLGTDVDIVTVETTLANKIRTSLCSEISAVYFDQ